jgi:hypothetical protein
LNRFVFSQYFFELRLINWPQQNIKFWEKKPKSQIVHVGVYTFFGNKIGPNLYGVVGKDVATHADFRYSDAMLAQEGGWSYELLNKYLTKPKEAIPGNKMVFVGLKKDSDRASVILYLRSLSDAPLELPAFVAVEETVEEVVEATDEAATDAM